MTHRSQYRGNDQRVPLFAKGYKSVVARVSQAVPGGSRSFERNHVAPLFYGVTPICGYSYAELNNSL